ncbi:MAG: serine hydrolase domain-containing protein, partial [Bacilli bacterium]
MDIEIDRKALAAASFSEDRLRLVGDRLLRATDSKETPGAVLVLGQGDATVCTVVSGMEIDLPDQRREMTVKTMFDLASLTKVCATLPAILLLIDHGEVLLSDRLETYFPEYGDGIKRMVTVKHLLAHSSGLPPGDSLPALPDVGARWRRVAQIPLVREPGQRVVYSDIGFMLLGRLVELISGQPFDEFVKKNVFLPLGMDETSFRPTRALAEPGEDAWGETPYSPPGFAATEIVKGNGRAAYAFVHDENAYSLGGVCGHAGLFSPAHDVARYARMWLGNGPQILSRRTMETALQCFTEGLDGRRGLGWCLRGDGYD